MKSSKATYTWVFGAIAFSTIVIALTLTGCQQKKEEPKLDVEFKSELRGVVPQELDVYVHSPIAFDKVAFNKKLAMLNLKSKGKLEETKFGFVFRTGSHSVLVSPTTGAEMYVDSSRYMVERPGKLPALDEKRSLDLANRFMLENIGMNPEEFNHVKTQYLHNAVQGPDGKAVETIDEAIAVFGRTINKTEIVGYGGFVKVHLDNAGKVSGYQKEWRNWQLLKKSQRIMPYAAAKEEFMKLMQSRLLNGGYARVSDVAFGYFERGFLEEQKYLQPAYVFNTVYYDKTTNESVAARLEVIPAISELLEPLIVDQDLSSRDDKKPDKP
jgi:hypothetical protein